MRNYSIRLAVVGTIVALFPLGSLAGQQCDESFDGTYALIQKAIFENKGCTNLSCHGEAQAGGLDLRADVSYDNLVGQPSETVPKGTISGLRRVVAGQKDQSLLFLNLASGTLPDQWHAPLRAMPIGLAPLSVNELEAVREWIEQGAPRNGTVAGTGELLDACLPPAEPIAIEPLAPPDPAVGRQVHMPKWILPAHSEREVCYTSYFDISKDIPAKYLSADGQSFRFKRTQVRQDPQSHHLIVTYYSGSASPDDPIWGVYRCRGGDKDGQQCPVTDLEFCGEGLCASDPVTSVACTGFGPADSGTSRTGFSGTQEASFEQEYPEDVFGELPTKGLLIWNSHAFNLTDQDSKIEGWLNFDFAAPEEQILRVRQIFDTSAIFKMQVPVFEEEEICNHHVFPPNTRLFELNSHNHKRGKRFRIFNGRYACEDGPNQGQACAPGADSSSSECEGAACGRLIAPPIADCNNDGTVGISDLTRCVNISIGKAKLKTCRQADPDGDKQVGVADLVKAVKAALAGATFDDSEPDLLYTNLVYDDPTVANFDPAIEYPGRSASAAARTVTFCSLYDNGFNDPAEVKNNATSPPTPIGVPDFLGGPCRVPTGCTGGLVGQRCSGNSEATRDASCDSSPGAGDGVCDACTLNGGLTTEDEMFIMLGSFYVDNR